MPIQLHSQSRSFDRKSLAIIALHTLTQSGMKTIFAVGRVLALLLVGLGDAKAGLVYDNGPINGSVTAWPISLGVSVSDSFIVSDASTLIEAQIGVWLYPLGTTPGSVDWSIGTTPFASDISSGTSTLINSYLPNNSYGFVIDQATFGISGSVAAGPRYWFTLQNLTMTAPGRYVGFWDQNSGPSMAFDSSLDFYGNDVVNNIDASESFQIYGNNAVPEPTSLTLFGLGALGIAGYRCRRRAKLAKGLSDSVRRSAGTPSPPA